METDSQTNIPVLTPQTPVSLSAVLIILNILIGIVVAFSVYTFKGLERTTLEQFKEFKTQLDETRDIVVKNTSDIAHLHEAYDELGTDKDPLMGAVKRNDARIEILEKDFRFYHAKRNNGTRYSKDYP